MLDLIKNTKRKMLNKNSINSLDEHFVEEYNKNRSDGPLPMLCYAPYTSMNFDQSGRITVCCFNRDYAIGNYPENSLKEIWNGRKKGNLQIALENRNFNLGCNKCYDAIISKNFNGVLMKNYDTFSDCKNRSGYPLVFEFEINNKCNLECLMCGGKWSSAIRKNREALPLVKYPYDKEFVTQIREFLPLLKRVHFLGGEPFLIDLYYDIWEAIIELNPEMHISITTNGLILNDRVKDVLNKLRNSSIIISVDSLNKVNYELIRKNGKYELLTKNIKFFLSSGKLSAFSVCPMKQNWHDIPELIKFCQSNKLSIHFNIVTKPLGGRVKGIHENGDQDYVWNTDTECLTNYKRHEALIPEVSLQTLARNELLEIVNYYDQFSFEDFYQNQLDSLINQLIAWSNTNNNI